VQKSKNREKVYFFQKFIFSTIFSNETQMTCLKKNCMLKWKQPRNYNNRRVELSEHLASSTTGPSLYVILFWPKKQNIQFWGDFTS